MCFLAFTVFSHSQPGTSMKTITKTVNSIFQVSTLYPKTEHLKGLPALQDRWACVCCSFLLDENQAVGAGAEMKGQC